MKIRNKIMLVFTLLTGSLFLAAFLLIYFFSYRYTENEFYTRLNQRANIIAQSVLEKDEVSAKIYDKIVEKYLQKLPEEAEYVFKADVNKRTIQGETEKKFPGNFIDEIFEKKHAKLKTGPTYHTGILYHDNEGDFIVVVSAIDQYGQTKMRNLRNVLIVAFLSGLAAIFIIGRYYSGKVLKPIARITEKANEISVSNLDLRLDTGNNKDELAELAITFNKMLDRLEASFETQTNFVNNASHELKNPLAVILGETEVILKKNRTNQEYKATLAAIQKEALRLDLLVSSLLKLAQTGPDSKGLLIEPVRIDELVIDAKNSMDHIVPGNKITFDFSRLPDQFDSLIVQGNHSLLQVALSNIMENACKFSVDKEVGIGITASANSVEILVVDKGVGIPDVELKNILEPFYRASNVRGFRGFGVGLPLAQNIINLHGGKISISSHMDKGTEVKIVLPIWHRQ